MNKNKLLFFIMLLSLLLTLCVPSAIYASTTDYSSTASEEDIIVPRVGAVDWEYSMINGKLYKRLYNYTTQTPLTDWILVT